MTGVAWDRARELAFQAPTPLSPFRVAFLDASGLTLAEDVRPMTPLPSFDMAAMDGYGVSGQGPYRLIPWRLGLGGVMHSPREMPRR